jgi:hypothetical protein
MQTPEPVVRVRCPTPEEEERSRAILERAGLRPDRQLGWLVVRDADPDRVNEVLVAGGALARVAAREQIGKLLGFVLDHRGSMAGRESSLRNIVGRVLSSAGLERRWAPLPDDRLAAGAAALHEYLMTTGAGFVSWERFLELFCQAAGTAAAPG